MVRPLLLVLAVVLLIRLPFLDQAIQGDDPNYLSGAEHAQIDPLHPTHARYLFLGQEVTMQGHSHPPFNLWFLGGVLALVGDIREIPFHAAYILFSVVAALGMWSLARRFSPRPLLATLLFLAAPAFVVNGNSFEADVPFLALWIASIALFVGAVDARSVARLALSGLAMALAGLAAYQAVLLIPILGIYLWTTKRRGWLPAWAALLAPVAALGLWQVFERVSSGSAPAAVLAGYFQSYGFHRLSAKALNAAALTGHTAWLICPVLVVLAFKPTQKWLWLLAAALAAAAAFRDWNPLFWASVGISALLLMWCGARVRKSDDDTRFLVSWVLIFFAGALAIFFAGSARYILPMVAPVALLATRVLAGRPWWLATGVALQMTLSLGLSVVNYQHWDGYRQFAASLRSETAARRVWINSELGLRYYVESDGGLGLRQGQAVRPGEMVITSQLAFPISFATGGGQLVPVAEREIRASLPLRLIGLGSKSGYSDASSFGLRPFDVDGGPIDRVRAEVVVERKPVLSYLEMNAPEAQQHIIGGLYDLEQGRWRWMSAKAILLLKPPAAPRPVVEVVFSIPDQSPARRVTLSVDDVPVVEKTYASPGAYTLTSGPLTLQSESPTVTIAVDRVFSVTGDRRQLGIVLVGAGFKPAK
jgi:hypothetical protein